MDLLSSKLACSPPASAKRIGPLRSFFYSLGSLARRLPSLLLSRRDARDPQFAALEYETRWNRRLTQRRWEQYVSLDEYLANQKGTDHVMIALMEGALYEVNVAEFYCWRAEKIVRIFKTFCSEPSEQPILELGCGYGKNLLALWAAGYRHLSGLDVSPSGVRMAQQQATHFNARIDLGMLDLTDLSEKNWDQVCQKTVFTHYALEQLPNHIEAVIDRLISLQPREVLHIETIFESLSPLRSLTDLNTWLHVYLRDYQKTLLSVLSAEQDKGRLEILDVIPLHFSPEVRSSPTLVRWRPVEPSGSIS